MQVQILAVWLGSGLCYFSDLENNYISDGIVFISALAKDNVTGERLSLNDFVADQDGYLQVFVAYESGKPIWFDDLKITHQPALVVQENHYYPFGMNITTLEKQGVPEHKFQFGEQEKQSEFGLDLIQFKYRMYDSQIGRWTGVDPLADKYLEHSSYNYTINNSLRFIDPDGAEIKPVVTTTYDKETNTSTINVKFNVSIAVLNNSTSRVDVKALATNIRERLEKALSGSMTKKGNGATTIINFEVGEVKVRGVQDAESVNDDENLVVVVDDVTGRTLDKDGNIGPAGGRAKYGAKVAYTEWHGSISTTGETSVHELGHNWNLPHNWEDGSPSDASGDNNYMSYETGKQDSFSPGQLEAIRLSYARGKLNRGGNTKRLEKDDYSYSATSDKKPYKGGSKDDKVPLPINETGK